MGRRRGGTHATFHSKAHVTWQSRHEHAHTHNHTQTFKNKFSIRQGFVKKAINEKARGC